MKYCSDRCRREKPSSRTDSIETQIERAFVRALGSPPALNDAGNGRKVVLCRDVEARIFGQGNDSATAENDFSAEQTYSEDEESDGGVPVDVSGSMKSESQEPKELTSQQRGRQRAANREKVRQAARRGVVFGFSIRDADSGARNAGPEDQSENADLQSRRRVEAVQGGRAVEASFAKGDWGVRWTGQD